MPSHRKNEITSNVSRAVYKYAVHKDARKYIIHTHVHTVSNNFWLRVNTQVSCILVMKNVQYLLP